MIWTDLANRNRSARRQIVGASSMLQLSAQGSGGACPRGIFYGKNVISGVYISYLRIFGAGSCAGDRERQRSASEPGEEYLAPTST
jgi:hypothetical protein